MDFIGYLVSLLLVLLCDYCHFQRITAAIKCDFGKFKNGCLDKIGSVCNATAMRCVCKPEYTVRLSEFCFQRKYIGDKCYASAQCKHIANAGCFNYREEYNQNPSAFFGYHPEKWPSGTCRCKIGHYFDSESNACVKKTIGSWCSNLWDCRQDARLNNAVCEDNVCKCSPNHHYNHSTQDCHYKETYGNVCIKKDDCVLPAICVNSTCDCVNGYHYNEEKIPKCQPNNFLEIKSEETLPEGKGDKSFEIFIITAIPVIIIFLSLKPCLKKFGRCKSPNDEVICGNKEISMKNSMNKKECGLHQFKREKLQTIEEVGEETKSKEEIAVTIEESKRTTNEKSIEDETTTSSAENKLRDSRESLNFAITSSANSLPSNCKDDTTTTTTTTTTPVIE